MRPYVVNRDLNDWRSKEPWARVQVPCAAYQDALNAAAQIRRELVDDDDGGAVACPLKLGSQKAAIEVEHLQGE